MKRPLAVAGVFTFFLIPSFGADAHSQRGVVYVNEVPVLELRSGSGKSSRAATLAEKLRKLGPQSDFSIRSKRKSATIRSGSLVLFTITAGEASTHGSSSGRLATYWVSRIRGALSLPALSLSTSALQLPVGRTVRVGLTGSRARRADLSVSEGAVASVKRVPLGFEVAARALGEATILVRSGDDMQSLKLSVEPYAANLSQTLSAAVSGMPASKQTVQGAIEGALRTRLSTRPDAEIKIAGLRTRSLAPGEASRYSAKVFVTAPGSFPSQGEVNISVANEPLPFRPDAALWYCNDPENLKGPGPLFRADLEPDSPTRLLYHHINTAPQGLILSVEVVNDTRIPARVLIVPGDADPTDNPVLAGVLAGERFLRNWLLRSGEIVVIPPRSTLPISVRRLAPMQTSSGLCMLRLLPDGPSRLRVRVDASVSGEISGQWGSAFAMESAWQALGPQPLNGHGDASGTPSIHVYPDPYINEEVSYEVGGAHGFIRIGQRPISNANGGEQLSGNFGVVYSIKAFVSNPTGAPADVEIVYEASAGYSGAVFFINGEVERSPMLKPKESVRLVRARLEPGAKKQFSLLTMPLSGSSYPATISVRSVDAVMAFPRQK